jgi:uncharacterized membrane protein
MSQPRGALVAWIWRGLWAGLLLLFATQAFDAWHRAVPMVVWMFWFVPLLVLLPGIIRDRLRSVTWLAFVSLLYFVWAVLRLFAEPESPRALMEMFAVVLLFLCSMFYVRERSRELRADQSETSNTEVY